MFDPRRFGFSALAVAILGLGSGCYNAPGGYTPPEKAALNSQCLTAEDAERMADQVVQLVNLERTAADHDLPPVTVNDALTDVAADYACRMIEESFFDHYDPITGRGPADRAIAGNYAFYAIGENLAAGAETAAEVVQLWMDSPSHREIILDPTWTEIGVAVRDGGEHSPYWVQVFGHPAPSGSLSVSR